MFETPSQNINGLEVMIEKALFEKLGFTSTTIIRSKEELQLFVNENPFKDREDTSKSKLNVTFLKNKPDIKIEFPYHSENKGFVVLGIHNRIIYSTVDLTRTKTPDLKRWLEKEFGKDITTRTWRTVVRILKKLNES